MFVRLIHLARKAAAAVGGDVRTVGQARTRHAMRTMLEFDERLLRDVGLTRADVVQCLSSPDIDPFGVLEGRRKSYRAVVLHVADPAPAAAVADRRLAA